MGRLRRIVAGNAAVRRLRFIAETVFTPRVRVDLASQDARLSHNEDSSAAVAEHLTDLVRRLEEIERHLPRLLNVISSGDGAARLLRRELEMLKVDAIDLEHRRSEYAHESDESVALVEERVASVSGSVSELADAVAGHVDTQRWLLDRVEMIRAEMLYELRHGPQRSDADTAPSEIVDPGVLAPADGAVRLNLGCGHKRLDGFANIDMRKIPGVDVVSPIDEIPLEPGSVAEIFSAHLLEHFPEEQLRRRLLPYWVGLLRPGGVFRAVVPDMGAMAEALSSGSMGFEAFRSVAYGGQEYEGDTHFTGFTAEHLSTLLEDAGLTDIEVVATARPEGDCLELEISATRPR